MVSEFPRLRDTLPELALWIRAALEQRGREELVAVVDAAHIHECVFQSDHASIFLVSPERAEGMMENPTRERIWVDRPKGVRYRPWAVTLEVIDGAIYHIGVSRPGVLRPALERLCRRQQPL